MISIASPDIGKAEIDAVVKVLRSGNVTKGSVVAEFEEKFASYIGEKHGISCSSGTAALQVGLEALGIKEGDEVITTPFTFIATSNAILYNKATPVFADIDEKTFNIDPVKIEACITKKTKAVLVVHLYGQPCRMDAIRKICKDKGLLLIEDCAQSHGAEYRDRKAGTFGDLSAFSFYATKNMVTGEGGMMLTGSDAVAGKASVIVNQGQMGKYDHVVIGYNSRMTNIEAAIGLEQLKKLDGMTEKRRMNAEFLTKSLRDVKWLETPFVAKGADPVWHQYTIKVPGGMRDGLLEHLNKNGVGARVYYPKTSYLQPAYEGLGYKEGLCPVAEAVSKQVLSLPVHPRLGKKDLETIVRTVKGYKR